MGGKIKHGGTGTKLYRVYCGIVARCESEKDKSFRYYGGRGIKNLFGNFEEFRQWFYSYSGLTDIPDDLSIDRINPRGHYCKSNLRLATTKTQANNRTNNRNLTHNGERHTITEWAEITGLHKSTIQKRLSVGGWSVSDALDKGKQKRQTITVNGVSGTKTELCKHFGQSISTINYRIQKGWDLEKAFTKPRYSPK